MSSSVPMRPDAWKARMLARPNTAVLLSDPYIDPDEGTAVEFRLTYAGKLLAHRDTREIARAPHKHEIRRVFHRQLKTLWQENVALRGFLTKGYGGDYFDEPNKNFVEAAADYYAGPGFRWVPLVNDKFKATCRLDILMLRPGAPGAVVQNGDIDNRMKTLFDALKRPNLKGEIGADAPREGEDPFFVLLEDDRMITHVSVETDTLLEPINGDPSDVRLLIKVTVSPYEVQMFGNLSLLAP